MQDLIKRTKNIIDKYKDELTKLGIKITVSRNQYETAVHERHRKNSPFNVIDYGIDYKRETERGYKFQNNKYIVDSVFYEGKLIAGVGSNQDEVIITKIEKEKK